MLKMDIPPDTATLAYVLATHPVFDMLKHAAAQLAAFSVLAAAGSDAGGPDHPLLREARIGLQEATDGLRAVANVPEPGRHHHRHLLRAAAAVTAALAALQETAWLHNRAELDPALLRLKASWQELHWATAALPGFEMVDLSQSCCAGHGFARACQHRK